MGLENLKSFTKPKLPVAFEPITFDTGDDMPDGTHILGVRKVACSEGQEWVGKYIYE